MKSEIKDNTPQRIKDNLFYPRLKRFGRVGEVVLFIAPRTGIVVANGKIGYYDNTWYEDETMELSENVEIILSN